eukprot:gene1808-3506_t
MQQSDIIILVVSVIGLILIAAGVYFFLGNGDESERPSPNDIKDAPAERKQRRRVVGKNNPPQQNVIVEENKNNNDGGNDNDLVDDNHENENDEGNDDDIPVGEDGEPLSRKEYLKLEKKKAKADEKALEDAQRTAKKGKQAKRDEKQREKDQERENAEKQRLEEEALIQQKKEEKAKEDYDQWKDMFSVEAAGSDDIESKSKQDLLEEFISYIKRRKVVVLDDLAIEFGLPAAQCVNRVQSLEEMGQLSGVVDDRGKFIYISTEELQAVAKFVKRKGRLSIADLAIESNKLINLKEVVEAIEDNTDIDDDNADEVDVGGAKNEVSDGNLP